MTETTIWWIVGALFLGYSLGRIRRAKRPYTTTPMIESSDLEPATLAKIDEALARGEKIEAIKLVREASGLSLHEAKLFIEAHGMPVARKGDPIGRG